MTTYFYNNALTDMPKAYLGLASAPTGTVQAILMTTAYTYVETDVYYSDLTGEATGSGYTAGGKAVVNLSVTQDNTINGSYFDFDNLSWTTATLTNVNAYVLYFNTGTSTTSKLIAYIPFTVGAQTINNGTLTITPPSTGVAKIVNT